MTTPFDVLSVPGRIADAGRAAAAVADGARAADVTGPVRAVAAAMPGSATASAAEGLAAGWQAVITGVADGFTGQAGALSESATAYRVDEARLVAALSATWSGGAHDPGRIGEILGPG